MTLAIPTTASPRAAEASPWSTLAIAAVAVFLVSLDTTVLFVALPDVRRSFPALTPGGLSWVLNAYTIAYGALLMPAGGLADRVGRKRLFLLGMGAFGVASLLAASAPSAEALIAARAAQALGAAALMPASLALVLAAFAPERRGVALGVWGAVGGLASALGPSVGAFVVEHAGWRWAFLLNVPPVLAALVLGGRRLAESMLEGASRGLGDLSGAALLASGVALLAYAVIGAREVPHAWAFAVLGLASLAIFARRSMRVSAPALDLRILARPTVARASGLTFLFSAAFTAMFFTNVFFLTARTGQSIAEAGLSLTPGPLAVVPFAVLSGRLGARVPARRMLAAGGALFALGGGILLALSADRGPFAPLWFGGSLVLGAAIGVLLPTLSAASVVGLAPSELASGSGINQAIRQLGSVLGVAFSVLLLGGLGRTARFDLAYVFLAGAGALLVVGARLLPGAVAGGNRTTRS